MTQSDDFDLSIYLSNYKGIYKDKDKGEQNRSNRSNRSNDRENTTFRMSRQVAQGFREYARRSGRSLVECIEDAVIGYMLGNPVEVCPVTIQRSIALKLPTEQQELEMWLITEDAEFAMKRLDKLEGNDYPELKKTLFDCLRRGVKVKNPTEEFIAMLMTVKQYVK